MGFLTLLLILNLPAEAQYPLLLDKLGTFEILARTDYTSAECGFSKPVMVANLQKIKDVVGVVRKNPVLTGMKGFDGRARIYNLGNCHEDGIFGVPSRISFEFGDWIRLKDGREVRNLIEPPEWSVLLNRMIPGCSSDGFSRKPAFFTIPLKKETIAPGIDVYGDECFVLYDPDRPPYWLPVTVKEAFDVVVAENKRNKDDIQREYMQRFLDDEWSLIPKEDWNRPATLSGMVSRVGTLPDFPPIMKLNPDYWDKSRPKSDIQFITFRMVMNKQYLANTAKEYLQANSTSYGLARFEASLDIDFVKSLLPLLKK